MEQQSFMTKYIVSVSPFAEEFLKQIAKDYNLSGDLLVKKYLYNNQKKFNNTIKKLKPRKTRKVTPYNIFLSDKHEIDQILKDNNTDNQTKINRQKGDLWEILKKNTKKIEKYQVIASLENKNLLSKNNRRDILRLWNKKSKVIKDIDNDNTDLDMSSVMKKLNLN